MRHWVYGFALFGAAALFAGCGNVMFMTDGNLALNFDPPSKDAFIVHDPTPPVMQRFAAQEAAATASDPNARSGANCAGGVCTIF
ncbi:MAG: hypothetical protein O3A46_09825 [Candidatus Poribacteria bacterium]|nr:hypothetical protein [Candidatus Poribacteria bacterium]